MKIIFDLDGTLTCPRKRIYALFSSLVKSENVSYEDYWNLKFSGKNNRQILKGNFNYSDSEIDFFIERWMNKIESDFYLSMDTLFEGVENFLRKASQTHDLYICTARQSKVQAIKQLQQLGVIAFFKDIYVTEQKKEKQELILDVLGTMQATDWFIGDTGHDVLAGKRLGIRTCAVLTGVMSEVALNQYAPDIIIDNVTLFNASNEE